jgi:hypothetical protein
MKPLSPFCIAAAVLLALPHCSKKENTESLPKSIVVLEKVTRMPIAGASVDLLRCAQSIPVFGCTGYDTSPIRTLTTDAAGKVSLPSGVKPHAIRFRHPDFWEQLIEGNVSSEILVSPNAWARIRMKRTGNYNAGSTVSVMATRPCEECGIIKSFFLYSGSFTAPLDTTFTVLVQANESTTVSWSVNDPVSPANNIGGGKQFQAKKAETVDLTIEY